MAQPLPASNKAQNFQRIQGRVTSLVDSNNNNKILTYTPTSQHATSQTAQNIKYDYVILATGATYTAPISPTPQELTLENRLKGWQAAHQCLVKAKTVIVLGGGAVGVELAAEIVDHYPDKQVTLLDGQWSLVPIFPEYVGDYALRWLEQRGVQVKLGQSLQSWTDTSCTLQDGTVLQADMVYVCFGSRPNSDVAQHQQLCALTNRQTVVVDETLQVQGVNHTCALSSIFACGDVASPPTHDEKQAFQAEIQGKVVARNVLKLLSNNYNNSKNVELYRYPEDIAGSSKMPLVFVLSLGRYDGVLGFNTLLVPGPLAAIAKWLLEYTKVLHMKGGLLGQFIWKLNDAVVLFLSRTLVLPASGSSSGGFEQQERLKVA
ncbi:NADH dehydrogenase [Nitzschia inconspicua]|uniref:NADH dehydrogenase n=1 Tax=Nitzschia inconspicua TaxID=303405 RepID=A0A9K3PC91_9STRA|nr:NADH dehydrogenase [Nitzschia inconspicua]